MIPLHAEIQKPRYAFNYWISFKDVKNAFYSTDYSITDITMHIIGLYCTTETTKTSAYQVCAHCLSQ